MVWEYSTDLYDASTAQQLFSVYQQLLEEMVQGAERLVSTLRLVSDEVAGELISRERWSSPYEREATIPELFGRAVEDRPRCDSRGLRPRADDLRRARSSV